MPNKKKKKRGFLFLGFIVSAVTIAIGVAGKAKGQVIEPPDRPPIRPPDRPPIGKSKEQFCIEAGGVFNDQFQRCDFPVVGCGSKPRVPGGGGAYLAIEPLGVNQVQWTTRELVKFRAPSSIVLFFGGFSEELLQWAICKRAAGELP
ncbi:MAG: hypothetical protein V3T23_13450 [Nitrososphaerales archaeon]